MHRTTVMIPDELKDEAVKQARERGVSLGHFVREALRESVERIERKRARVGEDPLFADEAVFEGHLPAGAGGHHDDELYGVEEG